MGKGPARREFQLTYPATLPPTPIIESGRHGREICSLRYSNPSEKGSEIDRLIRTEQHPNLHCSEDDRLLEHVQSQFVPDRVGDAFP